MGLFSSSKPKEDTTTVPKGSERKYGTFTKREIEEVTSAVRGGHGATTPAKKAWLAGNIEQAEETRGFSGYDRRGRVTRDEVNGIVGGMKDSQMFRSSEIEAVERRLNDGLKD